MRLFLAIRLGDEMRDSVAANISRLRSLGVTGNFTHPDSLHLTLVFIGETDNTAPIKAIMDRVSVGPFDIAAGGFGVFVKPGGNILWQGISRSEELTALQRQLNLGLQAAGFKTESGEYRPHLTLAREATLPSGFDRTAFSRSIPVVPMTVGRISLMRSDRVDGRMVYSEVRGLEL